MIKDAVVILAEELEEYLEDVEKKAEDILKESAEIVLKNIKKNIKEDDIWTGEFINNLKIEKTGEYTYIIYSDVFYAHLVEFGHKHERFFPLSTPDGKPNRLGRWAMDKLGLIPTNRRHPKGYLIFEDAIGDEYTGLEFKMRGKKVFRRAMLESMHKIPKEVEIRFETKYGGY